MASSPRYRPLERYGILVRRLAELRHHLLPRPFSPTGTYTDKQLDCAMGYRLLAHAEIESFLEDIAWEAVKNSAEEWRANHKASEVVIHLLANVESGVSVGQDGIRGTDDVVEKTLTRYGQIKATNHGVREEHLKKLILPVGVQLSNLDQTWRTNLYEFGKKRGEIAHNTVNRMQQQIDPRTEWQTVKDLLKGLKDLDRIIQQLSV